MNHLSPESQCPRFFPHSSSSTPLNTPEGIESSSFSFSTSSFVASQELTVHLLLPDLPNKQRRGLFPRRLRPFRNFPIYLASDDAIRRMFFTSSQKKLNVPGKFNLILEDTAFKRTLFRSVSGGGNNKNKR